MVAQVKKDTYTLEEYLELERDAPFKSEFVDGQLFAMAGARRRHNIIVLNIGSTLRAAVRGSTCRTMVSDMKVVIKERPQVAYYPDVVVECDEADDGAHFTTRPCLVVEVLSDSTKRTDRNEKKQNCARIPSIQTYLIVHQDRKRVEVCRRTEDGVWQTNTLENEGLIELECPKTTLTLEQIYEDVEFQTQESGEA